MLVYTAKLTKTKMALFAGAVLLLLIAVIAAVTSLDDRKTEDALGAAAPASFRNIRTNEDRIRFLEAWGWKVEAEPAESREVMIPAEFDDVYARYNELQQAQGLDLTKYAGKTVQRYTYRVTNYPGQTENVLANLLVCKNRVVGADICSAEYRGFMHGLAG